MGFAMLLLSFWLFFLKLWCLLQEDVQRGPILQESYVCTEEIRKEGKAIEIIQFPVPACLPPLKSKQGKRCVLFAGPPLAGFDGVFGCRVQAFPLPIVVWLRLMAGAVKGLRWGFWYKPLNIKV